MINEGLDIMERLVSPESRSRIQMIEIICYRTSKRLEQMGLCLPLNAWCELESGLLTLPSESLESIF